MKTRSSTSLAPTLSVRPEMKHVSSIGYVAPAKAGVQGAGCKTLPLLGSRFRRNDEFCAQGPDLVGLISGRALSGDWLPAALRFGELAQDDPALDQGEVVDEEDAVEVLDLVLQASSKQPRGMHF